MNKFEENRRKFSERGTYILENVKLTADIFQNVIWNNFFFLIWKNCIENFELTYIMEISNQNHFPKKF